MQANTQKVRQVDVQGGFTAAAGHNFYTARAFPEEYWNRIAFVNEPTGHVVHRAIIERQGSGFAEKDGWNIAASDDEWFAPVHAEVGPDGALWFLDFYDFIIQHNPTPIGPIAQEHPFQNGRGNAYDTPLREHDRGRIYRLVWKGAKPYTPLSLSVEPAARARAGAPPRQHVLAHDGTAPARRARQDRRRPADHRHRQRPHGRQDRAEFPRRPRAVDAARPRRARRHATRPRSRRRRARSHIRPPACARRRSRCCRRRSSRSRRRSRQARSTDKDLNVRLNALLALSRMPASVEAGRADLSRQQGSGGRRGRVAAGGHLDRRDQAPGRLPEGVRRRGRPSRGDEDRGSRRARRAWRRRGLVGARAHGCRLEGRPGPEGLERDRHSASTSARSGSGGRSTCRRTPQAGRRRSGWGSSTTPTSPTSTVFASAPP